MDHFKVRNMLNGLQMQWAGLGEFWQCGIPAYSVTKQIEGEFSLTLFCERVDSDSKWVLHSGLWAAWQRWEIKILEGLVWSWVAALIYDDKNKSRGNIQEKEMVQRFCGCLRIVVNFDPEGAKFTFSNKHNPPTLRGLYRFLVMADWLECFDEHRELAFHFYGSDHKALILKRNANFGGHRPLKFDTMWLENKVSCLIWSCGGWNAMKRGSQVTFLEKIWNSLSRNSLVWSKSIFGKANARAKVRAEILDTEKKRRSWFTWWHEAIVAERLIWN